MTSGTWRDSVVSEPIAVELRLFFRQPPERETPDGSDSIELSGDRWFGWIAGPPPDWRPFLDGLSSVELPKDSSISLGWTDGAIFGLVPGGANAPVLDTEGFVHGDTGPSERLAVLSIRLSMERAIPLIWDCAWHDMAWKEAAPCACSLGELLASSLFSNVVDLGLVPDVAGPHHWANILLAQRGTWLAKREADSLESAVAGSSSAKASKPAHP